MKPAAKYAILGGLRDFILDELAVQLNQTPEPETLTESNLSIEDVELIHAKVNQISDAIRAATK